MAASAQHKIAVVTDSTSDIPSRLVQQYAIHVVPQILIMGENTWLDGIDIDPPAFYRLLQNSSSFPSTSQPSVKTFADLFVELSREAEGIVAVLISNELSGTLNAAQTAAASLPDIPIEIIDSRSASMQLGFIALAAARAAAAGGDLQTVAGAARALVGRVSVYFVVDTLEYLHRGGRIGAAARLFGTALNLKPVLEIKDGIVTPVAKIRTRSKALVKVHELLEEQLVGKEQVHMSVLHIAAPDQGLHFQEELKAHFHPMEMIATECGPVVGAHAGPGTVGVAFYVE
jgi:DegV family protein with EDD domain